MRKKTVRIAVAMFRRGLTVSAAALPNSSVDYGKVIVPQTVYIAMTSVPPIENTAGIIAARYPTNRPRAPGSRSSLQVLMNMYPERMDERSTDKIP